MEDIIGAYKITPIIMKKIKIKLKPEERVFLQKFKQEKGRTLRETNRANILLLCDEGKSEKDISEFMDVALNTLWRIKKRYRKGGAEHALEEDPRPGQPRRFSEKHQTELAAIACSDAPQGRERWTLELLTEKMRSEVTGCGTVSKETVRLMLKKTASSPG